MVLSLVPVKFAIVTPSPHAYVHAHAFDEVAQAIHAGLQELGHDSELRVGVFAAERVNIIFGAHLMPRDLAPYPGSILFNLEQVIPGALWLTAEYLELMKRFKVWDYSAANVAALRARGVPDAAYVPIGYAQCLEKIPPQSEDIDVLFYGCLNDRRRLVLQTLQQRGVRVQYLYGVFGEERDQVIARSKIVLNVHFYEGARIEVARCFYLLINGKFVISEESGDMGSSGLADGMAVSAYTGLAERCAFYLAAPHRRARIARRGQEIMKARPQKALLQEVLRALECAGNL